MAVVSSAFNFGKATPDMKSCPRLRTAPSWQHSQINSWRGPLSMKSASRQCLQTSALISERLYVLAITYSL